MKIGGWSNLRPLNAKDCEVFNQAMEGLCGADYEPLLVSTQVVSGVNYKFICNAVRLTNPPQTYSAQVIIYEPLDGNPVVTGISKIL